MLVSQSNKTAAILLSQIGPVGVELFSDVNAFFVVLNPFFSVPLGY